MTSKMSRRGNNAYVPLFHQSTEHVPATISRNKDFVELLAWTYFFTGIYWTLIVVVAIINYALMKTVLPISLLVLSIVPVAVSCYKRCDKWYEYSSLEYYQPLRDLFRTGIKRKGLWSLGTGIATLCVSIIYGPFIVGALVYVDELGGNRAHRE